jgi:hypothetical protein
LSLSRVKKQNNIGGSNNFDPKVIKLSDDHDEQDDVGPYDWSEVETEDDYIERLDFSNDEYENEKIQRFDTTLLVTG